MPTLGKAPAWEDSFGGALILSAKVVEIEIGQVNDPPPRELANRLSARVVFSFNMPDFDNLTKSKQ